MSMTFNSLVAQVEQYLNRNDSDTIAQIPNFISQAEQRICREAKTIGLEIYVTGTFTPGVSVLAKPARWRKNITFNYGSGAAHNVTPVLLRSYEFLRSYWPDSAQLAAPQFYSDYGYEHFLIAPTPDDYYPFELAYIQLPDPITVTNQTNWLTNYAPDVLLYGTLLEAIPYLKNDERMDVWITYFDRGIASLNGQDDVRVVDRQAVRESD